MDEAKKTNQIRGSDFAPKYLSGTVIDIGCGNDVVVAHATRFDKEDGDANRILDSVKPASFDCVHSSHCLEHMYDPPQAIKDWWALVRPGGFMVIVVPDEALYEQGFWPSIFNDDHKATFRLDERPPRSPRSYWLPDLIGQLDGCQLVSLDLQDVGYDHWQERVSIWSARLPCKAMNRIRTIAQKASLGWADRFLTSCCKMLRIPFDQTIGEALAQIQVVLHKADAARA